MSLPELRLALVAVLLVVLAAVLAASEASVSRVTRLRAEQLVDDGRRGSPALLTVTTAAAPYLSVSTFVRVVCESFAAVLVTITSVGAFERWWVALVVAAAVMVVLSFVVVGVSPRTLGRQHAEVVALVTAPLLVWLARLLGPLARLLVALGNAVTPGRGYRDGPFSNEAELRELLDLAGEQAVIEAGEQEMLHSVFELGDTIVREVMVPRTDMVTIEHDKVLRQGLSLFLRSGFSRIPVVDGGPDGVLGMLYFKDVARRVYSDAAAEQSLAVRDLARPVQFVPESKPVDDLLREMQRDQNHVAVVVDEYGGTAGVVTLEDLVEELIGEVSDEHDRSRVDVVRSRDWFTFPGILRPDELLQRTGVRVPEEGPYETVAGWLMSELGRLPAVGDTVETDAGTFRIERLDGRRIDRARFTPRIEEPVGGDA